MYAIIDIKGKQYKVEEGRYLEIDLQNKEENAEITFDQVLMVSDGKTMNVGKPTITGASVKAKVIADRRDKKVIVYKMRRKKGYRLKKGHRQDYTKIMIESINAAVAV